MYRSLSIVMSFLEGTPNINKRTNQIINKFHCKISCLAPLLFCWGMLGIGMLYFDITYTIWQKAMNWTHETAEHDNFMIISIYLYIILYISMIFLWYFYISTRFTCGPFFSPWIHGPWIWRRSGLRLPQSWHQRSGGHFRAGDGLWENPEGKSGGKIRINGLV